MYRYHNKLLPPLFDDYFIQGKAIHDYYTRSSHKYRPLKARTNIKGCDYQADVCWKMSNTIKHTSVGKCQILSSRRLLVNVKYYQADDVNLGFESELKFLSNG